MPDSTDVFVIGGGPAGLAAAIAARQLGFRVTVADGAKPPIDKPCGEALMPDAIAALQLLGVVVPRGEAWPIGGVRFFSSGSSAEAEFPAECSGLSVRRTVLHRLLSERAADVGVNLLWQSVVTRVSPDEVRLGNRSVRTRWIVGADGVNSRVRRWAKLDAYSRSNLRYSFLQHYRVTPWSDQLEIYWGKECQAYATAVSDDQVCVAVASPNPHLRLEQSLSAFPELSAHLRGAKATSTERGALTANRKLKRVWRQNIALIGDASGTVDAITGEGLGLSFCQAAILAQCLQAGDLSPYQAAHRRLARRPLMMARLMLTLDGRPRLQKRTIQVFRKRPQVFRKLLALHVGSISPARLALDGIAFGWELLFA